MPLLQQIRHQLSDSALLLNERSTLIKYQRYTEIFERKTHPLNCKKNSSNAYKRNRLRLYSLLYVVNTVENTPPHVHTFGVEGHQPAAIVVVRIATIDGAAALHVLLNARCVRLRCTDQNPENYEIQKKTSI